MPDVYATITQAPPTVQQQLASVMELRGADAQQRAMREAYLSEVAFPQGARVLDAGCGTGIVTRALATRPGVAAVVGVDPSAVILARARELAADLPGIMFVEADCRSLPFEDSTFDVAVFHTTLCHVPGPDRALSEAFRVLRPGGWLVLFDGDYATITLATGEFDPLQACADAFIAAFIHDPWLIRRLPSLVRAAGFTVERTLSHGYTESSQPTYMLTIATRGADALVASGRIGADLATALKSEAARRAEAGEFFGQIAYASLIARKPM